MVHPAHCLCKPLAALPDWQCAPYCAVTHIAKFVRSGKGPISLGSHSPVFW